MLVECFVCVCVWFRRCARVWGGILGGLFGGLWCCEGLVCVVDLGVLLCVFCVAMWFGVEYVCEWCCLEKMVLMYAF